jgi:hypothetical protein
MIHVIRNKRIHAKHETPKGYDVDSYSPHTKAGESERLWGYPKVWIKWPFSLYMFGQSATEENENAKTN